MSENAQLRVSHTCHFCSVASSSLDIACPSCATTVCLTCAPRHLVDNPSCPSCRNREFCNPQTLRVLINAAQVCDSAENMWQGIVGVGRELFVGGDRSSIDRRRPLSRNRVIGRIPDGAIVSL